MRPPLADGLQDLAAGLEALVGHRELDELAEVVDLEGDPGAWLGRDALDMTNGKTFGRDHQYAHLVAHGFFKGQYDLASAPLPNPNCG